MTWFDDIQISDGADEAAEWAATQEYELRYRRSTVRREGLGAGLRKAAESINRLNAIIAGDPNVPRMRQAMTQAAQAEEERLEAYRADALLLDEERGW